MNRSLGSVRRILSRGPRENGRSVVRRLLAAEEWLHERYFEWRLGISTAGVPPDPDLECLGDDYHPYHASHYRGIRKVLHSLTAAETQGVLVDYGSGTGRVSIMAAAQCPFQGIVGVEVSPRLNAIARNNIQAVTGLLKCRRIDLVEMDAALYVVPDEATVLYFVEPFHGNVLDAVLTNIRASLTRAPRAIVLVVHRNDELSEGFRRQVQACAWLRLSRSIRQRGRHIADIYANIANIR